MTGSGRESASAARTPPSGSGFGGAVLSLLGLAAFLALWQGIVVMTRPEAIRRVTLAFSAPRADTVWAVVLSERGEVAARERMSLDPAQIQTGAAMLRIWLGSLQPTIAALPPDAERPVALDSMLAAAQHGFGGGLDMYDVPIARAGAPDVEALERARTLQNERLTRPSWLPDPWEALRALWQMIVSGEMLRHVIASLFRVMSGFAIAALLGIPFGLALGSLAWLSALTNGIIQALRPISPIAWLPAATLVLGGGDVAAVFLIFLASFFPIAVSTAAAVATVDLKYRRSALNFGVKGLGLATRVILPAALPSILTALRIALGISWLVVVAAEMLGVESGLGFLVLDARNQLRYDRVVAAMIMIGVIGLVIDVTVRHFERGELERRGHVR